MKKFLCLLLLLNLSLPAFAELDFLNPELEEEKEMKKYVTPAIVKNKFKGIYDDIIENNMGAGPAIYALNIRRGACIRYLVKHYKDIPEDLINGVENETQKAINSLAEVKIKYVTKYIPIPYNNNLGDYSYSNKDNSNVIDYSYANKVNRQIEYGYNAKGDFVPTDIGGQHIEYGYNAKGQYVPMWYGNNPIEYGYNAVGDYVPLSY